MTKLSAHGGVALETLWYGNPDSQTCVPIRNHLADEDVVSCTPLGEAVGQAGGSAKKDLSSTRRINATISSSAAGFPDTSLTTNPRL